jgi:hypothetical protein
MKYRNEGASCVTCLYEEDALNGQMDAKRRCRQCATKGGLTGWDPKPTVQVQHLEENYGFNKWRVVRRVLA